MKKNFKIGFGLLFMFLAYSCGQGHKTAQTEQKATKENEPKDTVKQCYTANYEKDSAVLNLKTIDSNIVEGDFSVHYANKPHNIGKISGSFTGDTLFVDYVFKTGNNPQEFTNPLAFLKKGDTLVMGVGVIESYMGRSYFAKDKPINFDRGKFTFTPNNCK